MQFSAIALFALSAGALALPTEIPNSDSTQNATDTVLARGLFGNGGDIASYHDGQCTKRDGKSIHIDPYQRCMKFKPGVNNVGINWSGGTIGTRIRTITFYKDDNCKTVASGQFEKPAFDNKVGANTCLGMAQNGGPFQSAFIY